MGKEKDVQVMSPSGCKQTLAVEGGMEIQGVSIQHITGIITISQIFEHLTQVHVHDTYLLLSMPTVPHYKHLSSHDTPFPPMKGQRSE